MKIWKEVNVRTGQEIDEDAPTTSVQMRRQGWLMNLSSEKEKEKGII